MFIDKVTATFIGGKGGDGKKSFNFQRRPDGGNAGRGGNIYLEAAPGMRDLRFFALGETKFKAGNGEMGGDNGKTGATGEHLVLKVPLGTIVLDQQTGDEIVKVEEAGTKYLVAEGGRGGLGNRQFKSGGVHTLDKTTRGELGTQLDAVLEIKLNADIVFLGFPNAGKSSLLNALTNANSKVGAYPFTTLEPTLGTTENRVRLMDLPGLIEGTVEGKGLGTRFTKHAETANIVAHVISLENEDIVDAYKKMRKEIEEISSELASKPEIIVLTKTDLKSDDDVKVIVKELQKYNENVVVSSIYKYEEIKALQEEFERIIRKIS